MKPPFENFIPGWRAPNRHWYTSYRMANDGLRVLAEMMQPDAAHAIALLAALSHQADFSVGCYCEDEARCHRSLLRRLLAERGADIAPLRR